MDPVGCVIGKIMIDKNNPHTYISEKVYLWIFILINLCLVSCNSTSKKEADGNRNTQTQDNFIEKGALVYQNHCAGCHGKQLQGGSSPALIHTTFKHGFERDSVLKSIRDGIPSTQMIGWSNVLSAEDIEAVTDYIMEVQNTPQLIWREDRPSKLETKHYTLKIEELVTEGIDVPWGIAFVDADRALITENKGGLRWMVDGKLDARKISGIPGTYAYDGRFGGMMDVAVDPEYDKNGWVYLAFSHNSSNSTDRDTPGMTKVVRGKIKDHQWLEEQVLFQVDDSLMVSGGTRWGCRFLIDKQGYLYFTIGDMDRGEDSQILSRPAGKIYRINRDGSIPKDNPLYGKKDYIEAIYSWGTRNAQGIAQHPETGVLYASDHGPKGGDELNLVKNGMNYGWPVITYGIDYDGSIISEETHKEGMEQPITYWTPSIAVGAIDFVDGKLFPKWRKNLLVGALKFEEIRRLVIDGDEVTEQEILLKGYGRVRDIIIAPDGALYVLTNSPDAVLRITPG